MKRSTPLKRTATLARAGVPLRRSPLPRAPMRRKSVARSPEETRARDLVAVRSGGRCEGCGAAPATDWAHRVGRAQGGPWCPSNGLHLCGPDGCHRWSHANPAAARSVGWMVRRGENPATVPALLHGRGWVQLTPSGLITPIERTSP